MNHHPRFERKLNRLSIRIFKITSCRVSKKKILLLWVNITSIFVTLLQNCGKNRIVAKTLLQKLVSIPLNYVVIVIFWNSKFSHLKMIFICIIFGRKHLLQDCVQIFVKCKVWNFRQNNFSQMPDNFPNIICQRLVTDKWFSTCFLKNCETKFVIYQKYSVDIMEFFYHDCFAKISSN